MSKTKKAKPVRFTFKKRPRNTGLYAVGHPEQGVDVKLNKRKFGFISPSSWSKRYWTVQYAMKKLTPDSNPNCDWDWAMIRQNFEDEQAARDWFQANAEKIAVEPLHFFDDEE